MKEKIFSKLKGFRNFVFLFLLFFNTTFKKEASADLAGLIGALMKAAFQVVAAVDYVFKEWLNCDTVDYNTLIAMTPVSYATSAALDSKGIMNMLSGVRSKDSICAENLISFKVSMVAWDAFKLIYDQGPGETFFQSALYYTAMFSLIGIATEAFSRIVAHYAYGKDVASNAKICLQDDGNTPMPYTDDQMEYLLGQMNMSYNLENVNSFNDKLCVKYEGQYFWLKNGECTKDSTHPICVENMPGYSNVLCAISPIGCPCIMHLQHGIYELPSFKKDSNGNVVKDSDGNPTFTFDPDAYKSKFLLNCRISRVGNGKYQPKQAMTGIIDESCSNMKGHSKRQFPITGGLVECMTNTARNIFEKPIFADVFSSVGNRNLFQNISEAYKLDLSTVLFYQSKIRAITNGRSFNALSEKDQANVASQISAFFSTPTKEYCLQCAASGFTSQAKTKTFLEKYSNLSSANGPCSVISPASCIVNAKTDIEKTLVNMVSGGYTNLITDDYGTLGYPAINALNIILNYKSPSSSADLPSAGGQDVSGLFNSIYSSISKKQGVNDNINALYNQYTSGTTSILKWTLFDKFNNQIKFISVFILTIWLCALGYRILIGEFKVSNSELTSLAIQVAGFYYIVVADFWKTFLFSFIVSISQGIGIAALEIADIAGQYTTGSCDYNSPTKTASLINMATCPIGYTISCSKTDYQGNCISGVCVSKTTTESIAATISPKLSCKDGTNIQYELQCSGRDIYGNCIKGKCLPQNSYIVKPNYEYPYLPVSYYSTTGALSCKTMSLNPSSTGAGWVDIPVCCVGANGDVKDASKILNNSLGYYVFYCPDSSYTLDEGYRLKILNAVFNADSNVVSGYNLTDVVPTGLKTTDQYGNVNNTAVVATQSRTAINIRVANAADMENVRAKLNLKRTYPLLKIDYGNNNTVTRDMSYLKFFDQLDCKIMRFLFIGLGSPGTTDINLSTMDANNVVNGILSVVKMIFGFFPFGILVFILMMFIAITLLLTTLRAVQSYIVGIFGLVMNVYISPFFFMMGLFPSFKGAKDTIIKNIVSYMVVPPTSFLGLGIYFFILDVAFFGNPAEYQNLFDATGAISENCYENNPSNAPLACIVNKVISKINPDQAYATLILNIALGMYAGVWGAVGATLVTSLFQITDTIQLFLPFISKLGMALLLIIGGLSVVDTVEETMKSLTGMNVDTKTGSFLDGGVKETTMGMFNIVRGFFS